METVSLILGIVFGIAGAIVLGILVLPEKKRPSLNKFLTLIHDIFNLKSLLIEKILKYLYIFITIFVIVYGFFLLFCFNGMSLVGLLLLLLGPIIVRLIYEGFMMFVLLVKNAMAINNRLQNHFAVTDGVAGAPQAAPQAYQAAPQVCKNCGYPLEPGSAFCNSCGFKND